jgi:predicted nucleic acid-binding protein
LSTKSELLLFDTSAALAFVDSENPAHEQSWELAVKRPRGLAGHAKFEFFSVLTRLPMPKRLDSADATRLIHQEFGESRFLPSDSMGSLLDEFTRLGITGGMVYDGLVAATARHHGLELVTCDHRAESIYQSLGIQYLLLPV